jgi:putative photosynthetic complex assembly protein 2
LPVIGTAVVVALLVWWASTGVILYLDGMPRRTFSRSLLGATLVLAAALYGIANLRGETTVMSAYLSFACGVGVWGWLEMSFLMGYVTGPRRHARDARGREWRHFLHAIEAILYHELAIIVLATVTVALAWHGRNQVGAWTVLILWGMRTSAKLNLFLGVRNLSEEFLPEHLLYLKNFFRKKPMNFLFPVSVTVSAALATIFVQRAIAAGATDFQATRWTLLATLLVLGLIEHWILVLPFSATALWSWGLRSRELKPVHGLNGAAAPRESAG